MHWWISLVIVVTACGSSSSTAPPLPAETNVELVGRGAEPFKQLRYRLAKGGTVKIAVTVSSVMMERPSPRVTTTMGFAVDDVKPDGMVLRSTVEHTEGTLADGTPIASEMVNFFEGTQIIGTLSAVGTLSDTRVVPGPRKLPTADLESEMKQLPKMFEQAAVALPNAPVGVGAAWRTRRVIDENGVKVTAVSTTTITAIAGDTIAFSRSTQLSGADQTITRDGLNVALTQIAGSGTATGTLDLARFAITLDSEDTYRAKVRDKKTAGATEEPMNVAMTLSMKPIEK